MTVTRKARSGRGGGSQQGISLLEVLVALTILAMAMGVVFEVFSGGLRNLGLSGEYTRAAVLAETQLAGIGVDAPLQVGDEEGEWAPGYHWWRRVEAYRPWGGSEPEAAGLQAYRVSLEVAWSEAGRERRVAFATLRLLDTKEHGR